VDRAPRLPPLRRVRATGTRARRLEVAAARSAFAASVSLVSMIPRPAALAAVAAAVAIAVAALARRESPPLPTEPPPRPAGNGADAVERPPEFPAANEPGERIARWVRIFASGDEGDVEWAASRLRRVGEDGRRAVREAGSAAIAGNVALVEQAL